MAMNPQEQDAATLCKEPFALAVERMAEAVMVSRWGSKFDPTCSDAQFGMTERIWADARRGDKAAVMDEMADGLSWLLDNPLAFLDVYAERKADEWQ